MPWPAVAFMWSRSTPTWPAAIAESMGQIFKFLGLSVGCIVHDLAPDQRRKEYAADVTSNEPTDGFDYLRDNGTR